MLQQMPIFGGIGEDALQLLIGLARTVELPRGAFFFREGEVGDSMFVLESGEVAVQKTGPSGEIVLSRLTTGDCFGEMALIDLAPRSASVQALAECRAFQISAGDLYRLYEMNLEQFALIQMNMARELSRRLREADARLMRAGQPPSAPSAVHTPAKETTRR